MTTELRETEQKYECDGGIILPPLRGLPGVATVSEPEAETLVAEYFDVDDLRLFLAGITLRRREGGADAGWHLKLPDDAGLAGPVGETSSCREVRMSLARGDRDRPGRRPAGSDVSPAGREPVPGELARLVRARTRGGLLRPVGRIETHRRRSTLRNARGESLAEIAVDEVAAQTLGRATTVLHWTEVEAEFTGGSPRLARAVSDQLSRSGLRPVEHSAKLERVLTVSPLAPTDGRSGAGRRTRASRRLSSRSPAGEVILAYLDAQAARLLALDPAVRLDEADAIHQMRVTARRLRAVLQEFPMVFPPVETQHLREELRWLGTVLGTARDIEVLEGGFRAMLAVTPTELVLGPVAARVTAHFAPREAAARAAVLDALDSPRYFALLDELDRLLADVPKAAAAMAPADKILSDAVGQAYRRTRRRMRRAWRVPPGPARDTGLHQARIAAKRARYAAEAVQPAAGKKARRLARRMKAVQSALGDHHDAVTAGTTAREIGVNAHLAGENAFTFGLLNEHTHHEALKSQCQARKAWKRAARRGPRQWPGRS